MAPAMQLLIWAIMLAVLGIAIWSLQDSIFRGASAVSAMWSLYTFFVAKWVYTEARRVVVTVLADDDEDEDEDWTRFISAPAEDEQA